MSDRPQIAVLLHGNILQDYRVKKMISTLLKEYAVDLFYLGKRDEAFEKAENLTLFPQVKKGGFKQKLIAHTRFTKEYLSLKDAVLKTGKSYDIIWSNDLPTLLPAVKCAEALNAKLVYDSHEIYTETLNQFFPKEASFPKNVIFKNLLGFMRKHGKKMENELLKKTDLIISVNESLVNHFDSIYSIPKPLVVMNFPFSNVPKATPHDFRAEYNWSEKDIIFLYQGALNAGRGLELLIKSFQHTPQNHKLVVLGGGPLKSKLKSLSDRLNLNGKVQFHPLVSLEVLPGYTMGADIGINLLEDLNLSKKLASPNKLFEYIHAGIPVVCSDSIENNKVLKQFRIGVSTPNDEQSIVKAMETVINDFLQNSEKHASVFENAKEHFSWEKQEIEILNNVGQLLTNHA